MKKLLAILLALMLVMVSAFALAEGDPENNVEDPTTEVSNPTGGNGEGGTTGGNTGSGSTTTPTATATITAADPSVNTNYDQDKNEGGLPATAEQTVTVYKNFNISGTGAKLPAQRVTFTVGTGTVSNSTTVTGDAPVVTIDYVDFTETDDEKDLKKEVKINLPAYRGVGVYTYPVTETDTNIAGEKYATGLQLKVTVVQGETGLMIAGIALRQNVASDGTGGTKTDTLENDYKANALTVGKTVTGNMGDQNKYFPITVVLTAPNNDKVYGSVGVTINNGDAGTMVKDGTTDITTTIAAETAGWETKTLNLSLKHGQTVKFDNLPEGVTYTVVENLVNKTDIEGDPEAYAVSGEVTGATALTADASVTITNNKTQEIDTGVTLETTAYMLIMALTMAGFAMMVIRRRKEY